MNLGKKIVSVTGFILIASCFSFAQTQSVKSSNRSETTVEDEYLSNIEDVIITELANSDDYDNKLVALSYLENAVSSGRQSTDMVQALSNLAGEGLTRQTRENGRVMNNFPDVRARACDLLGEIPTEESKNILYTIAKDDTEPMVVTAAIRSLGNIGINDNDEVVSMIEHVHQRYAALNATSSLAFEVLVAYEKLAPTVEDKTAMIQSISEIASNYKYAAPVRAKAMELLRTLRSSGSSTSSDNAK